MSATCSLVSVENALLYDLIKIALVRNAGNLVPHSQHFLDELTTNEPAALELGCVVHGIKHVIVCGHSNCKAMNLLYKLRDSEFASQVGHQNNPFLISKQPRIVTLSIVWL